MNDKEKKELISKILSMYSFSQAFSSLNLKDISDIKLNYTNQNSELINLQYRLVEKSSVDLSHQHSAKMFVILYNDIKKEYNSLA